MVPGRRNKEIMSSREQAPTPPPGRGRCLFAQLSGPQAGRGWGGVWGAAAASVWDQSRGGGLGSDPALLLPVTPGHPVPSLGPFPHLSNKLLLAPFLPAVGWGGGVSRSWVGGRGSWMPPLEPAGCLLSGWTVSGLESSPDPLAVWSWARC